jgi:carbamoylphosphate synthase large subunit
MLGKLAVSLNEPLIRKEYDVEVVGHYDNFVKKAKNLTREQHQVWKLLVKTVQSVYGDSMRDKEWACVVWNDLFKDFQDVYRLVEAAYQP